MLPVMMNRNHFILIALTLLLTACTSAQLEVPPAGTPLPTVNVDTIESLVADPNYLKGCRELNPKTYNEQAVYKDITPGKTTSLEVKKLVGDPQKVLITSWHYDGYDIGFKEFGHDTVSEIFVIGYPEPLPSLREFIEIYGCPDAIFAHHLSIDVPSEDTLGTLDMVSFVYSRIGLYLQIRHFPVQLSDNVERARYSIPVSFHAYIYNPIFVDTLQTPNTIKLMSWDEAVKE